VTVAKLRLPGLTELLGLLRSLGLLGIAAPVLKGIGLPVSPSHNAIGLELIRIINMAQVQLRDEDKFASSQVLKIHLQQLATGSGSKKDTEFAEILRSLTPFEEEMVPGWKADFHLSTDRKEYTVVVSDGTTTFTRDQTGVISFETANSGKRDIRDAQEFLNLSRRGLVAGLLVGRTSVGLVPRPDCIGGCWLCCGSCGLECSSSNCPGASCCYNCGAGGCAWCYGKNTTCCSCFPSCSCCL